MTRLLLTSATCLIAAPLSANACSYEQPPIEKITKEISTSGALIQGTLIQAFDAAKRQPEIIRADKIFIGDGKPRNFVIYRSKSEYDNVLIPPAMITSCDHNPPPFKVGQIFDRLVLEPAAAPDRAANGRWRFSMWGNSVARGRPLNSLLDEAARIGRLRSRPLEAMVTRRRSTLAGTRRATPSSNPGQWVTTNDYPPRALREEREGVVRYQLAVDPTGRVARCLIVTSSGHADLDQATCSNLVRRARFNPAQDSSGNPTPGTYSNRTRWVLPN